MKLDYLIADSVVKEQKDFITTDDKITSGQDNRNSSQYEFYQKLLQPKNTNLEAGENISNNEIQLGDLFEEFIRELEKDNYESTGRARKKRGRRRGI